MIEKLLDKYFINKIADYLIEYAKSYLNLEFKKKKGKDNITIYVNYKDNDKKLLNDRKVVEIRKKDIIFLLTTREDALKQFRERVDEVIK